MADGVDSALKSLNPFAWSAKVGGYITNYLGPLVERFSAYTLGGVYGDVLLNYAVSLLFMLSLLLITLSDQAGWTSPARTFVLKLHFLFIKSVRCIATIGLFFLGKAIGSSGSFGEGLRVGAPIVTAGFTLTMVQRLIEMFSMVVPGQQYYDTPLSASLDWQTDPRGGSGSTKFIASDNLANASNPVPWIHGSNWGVTLFMVLREYLNAVTQPCLDALVGTSRVFSGIDVTADMVDGMTQSALNTANVVPTKLRFLWQFNDVRYTQGTTKFGSMLANDMSSGGSYTGDGISFPLWYYSPLFVGIVVGLYK